MIRYALRCASGHMFESWFPSSTSYEEQRARGFVSCPDCGSTAVEKALMAPAVARSDRAPVAAAPETPPAPPPVPTAPEAGPLLATTAENAPLRELLREIRDHVVRNSENVGDQFTDLALKMHHGEIEQRAIYGKATPEEVQTLHEDEVEVFPLPVLPEEHN